MKYPLAPNGCYLTIQAEGHLRGAIMCFLRTAGCSVGCPECDTDYSHAETLDEISIADKIDILMPKKLRDRWIWITGGEPLDLKLTPLIRELKKRSYSVALATSGVHRAITPVDWLSVSYHGNTPFRQKFGSELKIVDSLNKMDPREFIKEYPDDQTDFMYKYIQPLSFNGYENRESLNRCLDFLKDHPNWLLSRQDHLVWDMP